MIRSDVTANTNLRLPFDQHALQASRSSISSLHVEQRTNQFERLPNELTIMLALLNDTLLLNYNQSAGEIRNATSDAAGGEESYSQEVWQKVFWICLFSAMVVIAFLGNSGVILIVLLNKQMRTVTNAFIVNLSISDILVSGGNVIFNFVYMLNGHWVFGRTYCKISNFIAILSVACSCFTLMAISIDR